MVYLIYGLINVQFVISVFFVIKTGIGLNISLLTV